jgi:hypothetical protein
MGSASTGTRYGLEGFERYGLFSPFIATPRSSAPGGCRARLGNVELEVTAKRPQAGAFGICPALTRNLLHGRPKA